MIYEAWQVGNTVISTFRRDWNFINLWRLLWLTIHALPLDMWESVRESTLRTVPSSVVRLSVCRLNNIDGRWLNMGCKVSVELKLRTQTEYSEAVPFTTAKLPTKNVILTALESDPAFWGEKPGLSYSKALPLPVTSSFLSSCLTSGSTTSIHYFVECITEE